MENLNFVLKSKINYNKLIEKGKKTNKILDDFLKLGNKEQGSILSNNISRTKSKFTFSLSTNKIQKSINSDFNIDIHTLSALHEANTGSDYYRKVIKEKIKYENQLREELISLTRDIYHKKQYKIELDNKLSEIYLQKASIIQTFNNKKNQYKKELLDLQDEYDKEVGNAQHKRGSVTFDKEQMKKVISTTNKNYAIDNKLRKLKDNYTKNLKIINSQRDEIMKLIKINNEEIEYYKLVNDELIKNIKITIFQL